MRYAVYYFILISLIAVIMTAHDKSAAGKGARRVPEKTLFITAFAGGAVAMYITMLIIRHKTLHKRFMIGLPLIILLQIAAVYFAAYNYLR